MSLLTDDSPIITKTKELCAEIAGSPMFAELQARVERFLGDEASRNQYREVHQMGEQLHQQQHAGIELAASEIQAFEGARDALFGNPIATEFMDSQQKLEKIQKEIGKYVSMTLELGRVPGADDLAEAGGCCGGGGGGGCGCHDEADQGPGTGDGGCGDEGGGCCCH
ncbi:MAG: YlbF family regulator [Akkermansiaceae bacterium]|nr:YlbF family regulator [Akkermansiaceae bacterium]